MLLSAFEVSLDEETNLDFPDTENDTWYAPYVNTAVQKTIAKGYPDGTFKPTNPVIRAEYLKILLETAGIDLADTVENNPYYDVKKEDWFAKYAVFAKQHELFSVQNNKFLPEQPLMRGEVADTIYKLLYLQDR